MKLKKRGGEGKELERQKEGKNSGKAFQGEKYEKRLNKLKLKVKFRVEERMKNSESKSFVERISADNANRLRIAKRFCCCKKTRFSF